MIVRGTTELKTKINVIISSLRLQENTGYFHQRENSRCLLSELQGIRIRKAGEFYFLFIFPPCIVI